MDDARRDPDDDVAAGSNSEQLWLEVYDELRRLAAAKMKHEQVDASLQATSLVHEAYVRLVRSGQQWDSRRQFFAAAAAAMRRILIDRARRRNRLKRGGQYGRQTLPEDRIAAPNVQYDVTEIDEALNLLQEKDPRKAELVRLRYYVGLPTAEAAEVLDVSVATAERDWAYAKAWLRSRLSEPGLS